jgi:hypothetical protein
VLKPSVESRPKRVSKGLFSLYASSVGLSRNFF